MFFKRLAPSVPRSKYYGKGIDSSEIYFLLFLMIALDALLPEQKCRAPLETVSC